MQWKKRNQNTYGSDVNFVMKCLSITFLALLFSCKPTENIDKKDSLINQGKQIEFNVIKEGTNSGFKTSGKWYIEKESGLPIVWDSIFVNYMQKDPLPKIDFNANEVYVVTMGEQNSGGYTIKVASVIETKKEVVVTIEESKPGKSCMTTSVMTYPYQLFTIPKIGKTVRFNWIEKIYDCGK